MMDLSGAQVRQSIDAEQLYTAYRDRMRDHMLRFSGSMAWKSVGGSRYLYRKRNGAWKSLGPRSSVTEDVHAQFHAGREASKARLQSLDAEIAAMAPVNRAMRLGRVPWTAARVLRRLDRQGLLGQGLRVAGTYALYAYERMGGVFFGPDAIATIDIDLLYDARIGLDLVSADLREQGLIGLLKTVDGTFAPTEAGSFRAVNDKGFMVDLITSSACNPATRKLRNRIGSAESDLAAVEIAGLAWLESSPAIEQIVIDERGFPLTIFAPDPRAFVSHKAWLARRDDRHPIKQQRDAAQARELAAMLVMRLPHLRFDDPALNALPVDVRSLGATLAETAARNMIAADGPDWDSGGS